MTFNYGIIGNCKSAALVSKEGSIEWACFPRFDSPSVFAKILDVKRGGSCEIIPVGKYEIGQRYLPNTNILETRFRRDDAEFVLYDFFPRFRYGEKIEKFLQINRYIKVVKGQPKVRIIYNPKFDYAKGRTTTRQISNYLMSKKDERRLYLYSDFDLNSIRRRQPIELSGEHYIILSYNQHLRPSHRFVRLLFARTRNYWRDYIKSSSLPKRYKDAVVRSILALKLLTHEDGAIIAAPTTSLPEVIGEQRNWDYRYCWLRDAAFTVDALTKICHFDEAENFLEWLTSICIRARKDLQIVYRVDGEKNLHERTLSYLSGYKNSKPVRIGNRAYIQKQLDIFGEVIDAFYLFFDHYNYKEMHRKHWKVIEKMVLSVTKLWREPDSGLWEFRGTKEHFTFSKLMCWVALDRAVKMAKKRRRNELVKRWIPIRDEIRRDIFKNAWSQKKKSFTQSYGSDALDASNLLMPYFGFLPATHPKMRRTIEAAKKHLMKDGFVFRYLVEDDFGKPQNAFTICTFWLIDALFLMGNRSEANKMFRYVLKRGNYLGLFSEDVNPTTQEMTGNFPQAYTHLAIINTVTLLSSGQPRRAQCNIRIEMLQDT